MTSIHGKSAGTADAKSEARGCKSQVEAERPASRPGQDRQDGLARTSMGCTGNSECNRMEATKRSETDFSLDTVGHFAAKELLKA
jgi:hypothetical protein